MEVDAHDVVITPDVNVLTGKVNFRRHPAAAANEPSASRLANAFTQASVVEAYGEDSELSAYLIVCLFTCRPIAAGGEILWNYGEGYDELRQHAGYAAGQSCPENLINQLALPVSRMPGSRRSWLWVVPGRRRRFTLSKIMIARRTRVATSGFR